MSLGVRITASPPGYCMQTAFGPRISLHHPLFSSYLSCNCSSTPGDYESTSVLDAFFLGKALAEELNERIESTVGEFPGTIGRLQAEQQKQVQEFQAPLHQMSYLTTENIKNILTYACAEEDALERAKNKAAGMCLHSNYIKGPFDCTMENMVERKRIPGKIFA